MNIKAEILKPTEYKSVSVLPRSCSFKILRIRTPGMNVRYTKPMSALMRGI
ncbi:MAG: hypothetical protein HPY60_10180 [Candidatus Methanofastidiosum sp.]|nr:hypothetical protein [Methanofastidiosum sp.]